MREAKHPTVRQTRREYSSSPSFLIRVYNIAQVRTALGCPFPASLSLDRLQLFHRHLPLRRLLHIHPRTVRTTYSIRTKRQAVTTDPNQ